MCELLSYRGDDCHIIYKNIVADNGSKQTPCQLIRQHIENLWAQFKPYADTHFVEEFRHNPDQRYWEMHLGCHLLNNGLRLNTSQKGPDFNFELSGNRIWVEAITPTAGHSDNPNHIPELILLSEGGGAQETPRDKIILRFRAALDEKEKKFKAYVQDGTVGKDDIKVIALSSGAIRGWSKSGTLPYILSAVFPIGHAYVTLDKKTGEIVGQGYNFQPAVSKANGAEVETLFFTDPAHSDISAVVYSDADLGNPRPPLGNDLLVIHNPLAANPLPHGLLPCALEYWAEEKEGIWELQSQQSAKTG